MGMLLRRHADAREAARRAREQRERLNNAIADDEQAVTAATSEAPHEDTGNAEPEAQQAPEPAPQQSISLFDQPAETATTEPAEADGEVDADDGAGDESDGDDTRSGAPSGGQPHGGGRRRRRDR